MPENKGPYVVTSIGRGVENSEQAFMAALLVLMTDWDGVEQREGRRGTYATTGANSFRLREIPEQTTRALVETLHALGHEISPDDVQACFQDEYDYQVSYSINRFPLKKQAGLSTADVRAIDRVRELMASGSRGVKERLAG